MSPSAFRRTVHRRHSRRVLRGLIILGVALTPAVATAIPAAGAATVGHPASSGHGPHVGPITEISQGCPGQNAEAEQAVDGHYVYVTWIGCDGIGFARSANGGRTFGRPVTVPGSIGHGYHRSGIGFGLPKYGWDPSVAVAPTTPSTWPTCCTAIPMSTRWWPSPMITEPRSPGCPGPPHRSGTTGATGPSSPSAPPARST